MAEFSYLDGKINNTTTAATWIQGYQQASFRGVEFFINAAEGTGGRRIKSHAFADRDDIYHEDLGRAGRTFKFPAYIIGDNYFQHRENLIAALEAKGPGKLVHPYRGIFDVAAKPFSYRESTAEGRIARFELEFAEQKVQELTVVTANTTAETAAKKTDLIDTLNAAFETAYTIAQMSVTGVQDALAATDRALSVIISAKKVASTESDLKREVSNMQGKAVQFVLDATSLAESITGIVNYGTNATATADNAVEQLREMQDIVTAMSVNETQTPDDIFFDSEYAAYQIQTLVAQAAIAGAVGLTAKIEYATTEQAQQVQTDVLELLDTIMADTATNDEVYAAARSAQAAIVEDLESQILDLSSIVDYTPVEMSNTLQISNELYGSIDYEQDIIDRNNVFNPMFIPAAVPIQVVAE